MNKIICGNVVEIMKGIPKKNFTENEIKDGRSGKWKNAVLVKT